MECIENHCKCTIKWERRYTAIFMHTFRVGFYTPRKGKGCVPEKTYRRLTVFLWKLVDSWYNKSWI